MLVRFRQTAAGLRCSLVETRRTDGAVRYEQVASVGSVPASPSVSDRIAFWRRVYETLAELAGRIDAETQGKIIPRTSSTSSAVLPKRCAADTYPCYASRPGPSWPCISFDRYTQFHFERGRPCQKGRSRRRNQKPN